MKWCDHPTLKDARHLQKFFAEYESATQGYIVSRTPSTIELSENIIALPWQKLKEILT